MGPLRKLKQQVRGRRDDQADASGNQLVVAPVPPLRLDQRDPRSQIPFIRSMSQAPRDQGSGPKQHETNGDRTAAALRDAAAQVSWYHTIELPGGVVTPGFYDHRPLVPHYGIPDDLAGKRVLDVATADGFWAFEFERRGADVVAADISRIAELDFPPGLQSVVDTEGLDAPTGAGFALAQGALGSKVERVQRSVYDLDPAETGTFDLVHAADILLHLESPIRALQAIRAMAHGTALITDCFDPLLEAGMTRYLGGWENMTWWSPSLATLGQMILDAGFGGVHLHSVYRLGSASAAGRPWRATFMASTDT